MKRNYKVIAKLNKTKRTATIRIYWENGKMSKIRTLPFEKEDWEKKIIHWNEDSWDNWIKITEAKIIM